MIVLKVSPHTFGFLKPRHLGRVLQPFKEARQFLCRWLTLCTLWISEDTDNFNIILSHHLLTGAIIFLTVRLRP